MRKACLFFILAAFLLAPLAATAQVLEKGRLRDVLPDDGLDKSSVVVLRDQAALNAHYYLADETVLGLSKKTEALFARYRTGPGVALLLVVAYPSDEEARRVYERFGRDFFLKTFDGKSPRTLEKLETGDYAAAVLARSVLIVVLEAPNRKSCDELARRAEERALALF
ncbi:MAG: hypothetical protein IMZ54_08340 [Acidobacteria bacterium]|nr:hypothetical protein [Acidobacteriota bacterium]MBE3125526.1 hypothetical protein [Acidobacteriota bacterium]MBE3130714.1 hypothetical protein [Acidobacteriota bacterium]